MKALLTTSILAIALSSCVATSGDLRELADDVRSAIKEGEDASSALASGLDELADELDERTAATKQGMMSLEEGGILGGAATLAAYFLTNAARDRKRKKRGEIVSTDAPDAHRASSAS